MEYICSWLETLSEMRIFTEEAETIPLPLAKEAEVIVWETAPNSTKGAEELRL